MRRRGLVDWRRESKGSRGHSLVSGQRFLPALTGIRSLCTLTGRIWRTVGRSSSRTQYTKVPKLMSSKVMPNRTFRNRMLQEEQPPWWPIGRTIPPTRMYLMNSNWIGCRGRRGTPWIRQYICPMAPLWYCRTMQSHSSFLVESNRTSQNLFTIGKLQTRYRDWCWKIPKMRKDQERLPQGSKFWRRQRTVNR